jgi:hypothetical protein
METNMRQLKFRVWDDNGFLNNDAYCLFPKDGYGNLLEVRKLMDYGQMHVLPNAIMSQYTGLKDKNGVEIYEGDFIRFGKMEGLYSDQMYPIVAATHPIVRNYSHLGEVIGNIFENPELLES